MTRIDWRQELQRLRQTRFSELTLEDGGSWPWILRLLTCVLIVIVTGAVSQWYLATPRAQEVREAQAHVEALMSQYSTRAFQAANLPLLETRMDELDARMKTLLNMLPTDAELPALLDDISEAARQQQLEIDFIRLGSPVTYPFYVTQPFNIQVRGSYHDLAAFVSSVAGLSRIVTLHDFTLAPVSGEVKAPGSSTLVLSLQAETYRYELEKQALNTGAGA